MTPAPDPRLERYTASLRRGHLAARRGQLEGSLAAYGEAASIAPERALPHASMGSVLRRLGRSSDALAAYDRARDRAALDPDVALARAELLVELGRRDEAADAFRDLAEQHDGAGRPSEAADAAAHALDLADSPERRQSVAALAARLRTARLRIAGSLTADLEADPLPRLLDEAQAQADGGEVLPALALYRQAAALLRDREQFGAAIDACTEGLGLAPTDGQLHLDLAELYLAAGWRSAARDKLRLVARLAALEEDADVRARVVEIVQGSFAEDEASVGLSA